MVADCLEVEDARIEAIVEVGGEVGDFVGEIDQLRLERRSKIEEVFGEFGMRGAGIVAGMLDDAFAHAESEIEAAVGRIALFKPGNDAQGMQVVVETETVLPQSGIEGLFAGVAKGGMADVVGQGKGLGEFASSSPAPRRLCGRSGPPRGCA